VVEGSACRGAVWALENNTATEPPMMSPKMDTRRNRSSKMSNKNAFASHFARYVHYK